MISIEILTKHVAAAKQQDREAFTFLFDHTKDYTYSIAYSLLQDTQEAQDIVQEVYLRVWLHLSDLHEDRSFLRWLHSITFNISQDHLRQKMQQQNALDSSAEDLVLQKTSFDEWFLRSWKQETIRDMVQALPEEQREAVYLFYFQDRTVGEIAAIQNCSINTVKSRLFYARNTLQKLIETEEKKTGEMHLPPAVIAMTSVMMLPMMQIPLPHADSLRILMAVFAAAESMNGGISFAQVYDERESRARRGFFGRLVSAIEKHWIIRIHSSTVIALLAAVIFLSFGFIFIGRILERQASISDVQTNTTVGTEIAAVPENPIAESTQPIQNVLAEGKLCDTVRYTVTDDGVLRISGEGRVGFEETWRWEALKNGEDQSVFQVEGLSLYRETVTSVIIEDGITEIAYGAFARSPKLETISFPESCTRIGAGAFFACPSLTAFVFPPRVADVEDCVLKNCTALKTIVVSEDARYIGSEALSGCTALETVEFRGNKLKTIGGSAFCELPSLKTLTLPDSVEKIMSGAFCWLELESLDLSNLKHTVIDSSAIRDCTALKTLLLPQRMDRIASTTVYNCPELSTVVLGKNTVSISKKAFHSAPLTEITIPASVSDIAAAAFAGNKSLVAIRVDDGNPYYRDVDGVLFNRSMDTIHTYPIKRGGTSYVLPESVSVIAHEAFAYNTILKTLVIPGDIRILENRALANLSALTGVYFQSSMPEIWAEDAIMNCNHIVLYYPKSAEGMTEETWIAPDGTEYRTKMTEFSK